jgi:Skp family chaperone for outer membrane proteins
MAIAPIDLQTIFTQVDKVGRSQAAQKEGQALQQTMQGVEIQRKTEELIRQVNETQNMGEGADKIKDKNQDNNKQQSGGSKDGNKKDDDKEKKERISLSRDPSLGNKIDISL